ncbi:hypothetical protein AGLY_014579, partial [Aphis glycines]
MSCSVRGPADTSALASDHLSTIYDNKSSRAVSSSRTVFSSDIFCLFFDFRSLFLFANTTIHCIIIIRINAPLYTPHCVITIYLCHPGVDCHVIKLARVISAVDFWRAPVRIMILFGLYYIVKRAIYLSSKKIFNGGDHKRKKSKRKNKRNMKGKQYIPNYTLEFRILDNDVANFM